MKKQKKIDIQDLNDTLLTTVFTKLEHDIRKQQALMRKTEEIYLTYHEKIQRIESKSAISKYINETQWLKSTTLDILEEEFPEKREITVEEEFDLYFEKVKNYINGLEKEVVEVQGEHCFYPQKEDSFRLKLRKRLKNSTFQIVALPNRLANWFRKDKKPIKRWSHNIPLQAMSTHYFVNLYVLKILPYYKELQKLRCEGITIKWDIVTEINEQVGHLIEKSTSSNPSKIEVDNLLQQIDNIRNKHKIEDHIDFLDERLNIWKDKISKNIKNLANQFYKDIEKVDTIELPKNTFSTIKIKEGQRNYRASFLRLNNGWRNTIFAQLDDFQVDLELYHITYSSLLQFFLLQQSTKTRTRKTLNENIDKIRAAFAAINIAIKEEGDSEEAIVELLKRERRKVKFKLESRVIPEAIEAMHNQSLPYLLDRLEQKIKEQIERMKDKRLIYADHKYNAPINRKDLDHFNPKNLVMVDIFSRFSEQNKKLKGAVVRQLEQLQVNIKELSGIIDFNLDSAINSIKETEEKENITDIALEGIERTQNKVNKIQETFNKLIDLIDNELKGNIDVMGKRLIELTNTANITELKLKLAQAQTIEKTKHYRKQLVKNIKAFVPLLWRYLRGKYSKTYSNIKSLLEKHGVIESENRLTAELSDFLYQADEAVEKLPYVYRRLYRIQPLEEEVFFEGRSAELTQLKKAYQNWQSGSLSSCSIVGEKGSGASSLINFFSKEIAAEKLLKHKLDRSYSSEDDFITFFQEVLQDNKINSFDDTVKKIENSDYDCIVLEDLQNFYLKKIHGFNALELLFELISTTARKVFWVIEITTYAWTYLENTLNIQSYFKYNIKLSNLTDEQIIQLIMRRHRVSGYNLKFKPKEQGRKESRKLKRMGDEEEKQAYLKKQFFSHLNNFAQSNISLALIYWLRSTHDVDENTIFIGNVEQMQYDFVNKLNELSIFTLHALLIHDSLNITEHAVLFHQSEHQSKMTLLVLEDRGILKKEEGRYTINRLLYRQVVNALRKKNIIH